MKYRTISIPMLALLAGACTASGGGNNQAAGNAAEPTAGAANGAAPANGSAPANTAAGNGAASAAGPLSAYVGHMPWDAVNGATFLTDPQVRAAVEAAIPDAAVRRWVLEGDGPSNPIAMRDGRLLATGCERHNCGPHNWSILIDPAGTTAEVCYARNTVGDRGMWSVAGRPAEERPGACPTSGG